MRDGRARFAGRHVLVDLWGAQKLDDLPYIEETLEAAALVAGATILEKKFHVFSPNNGVTGVLVLAESHISIHTWPEANFAAIDIFMCGECDPEVAVPVIEARFEPENMTIQTHRRGLVSA